MKTAEKKSALRRKAAFLPKAEAPRAAAEFLALPQVEEVDTVMLFSGVGRELDTQPILEKLLDRGKRVVYPVCLPGRKMVTRAVSDAGQLVPGTFGIPAPGEDCPLVAKEEIGVVLVPCLMCDREGYRLGFGGGYYDRWLADYEGLTVCICPEERLTDRLPRDEFDIPVKLVLT